MTKLVAFLILLKNNPYKVILFQFIINGLLLRLLYIETNDYARLFEIIAMLINLINPLLAPICVSANEFKDDKSD
jgi:hypothetical protein